MEETVPCHPWSDFLPRRTTTIVHISRPNMNLKLHLKMAFKTKQKSRDNITVLLFILLFRQTNTLLWTYLLCYYSTVVFPQKWIRMTNVCKVNVAEIWMWCLKFEMKCLPEAVQAKKKKNTFRACKYHSMHVKPGWVTVWNCNVLFGDKVRGCWRNWDNKFIQTSSFNWHCILYSHTGTYGFQVIVINGANVPAL